MSEQHDQYDACITQEDGDDDASVEPGVSRCDHAVRSDRSHVCHGGGGRCNAVGADIVMIVRDACHDEGEEHVEHGANQERAENADGHVPFRVLRFLRRRAHRIEADVGKEDDGCAAKNARPAVVAKSTGVFGNEGREVFGSNILKANHNKGDDHQNLQQDHDVVEEGTPACASHQDERQDDDQEHGGQVDDAAVRRAGCQFRGKRIAQSLHHDAEVAAPGNTHRDGCHGIFQD